MPRFEREQTFNDWNRSIYLAWGAPRPRRRQAKTDMLIDRRVYVRAAYGSSKILLNELSYWHTDYTLYACREHP
jgi:hypothetical protein